MELFTMDPTLNNTRQSLIEHYESFIWTDRYSALGDVQIVAEPTAENIARLVPDTLLGFDLSDRAMFIETASVEEDEEGKEQLKIKGSSYERVLADRIARSSLGAATWGLTGTIGSIATYLVDYVCHLGSAISASDVIPGLTVLNSDTVTASRTVSIKTGTLYDVIKELCDSADLGFRIKVTPGSAALSFQVYAGTDRSGKGGVSFSKDLENLSNSASFNSKAGYKNVAYVVAPNGQAIVTATGASAVSGLDRRVLFVDASDITTAAGSTLTAQLQQRGKDELSKHQSLKYIDGTVDPTGIVQFNRDYFMGDLVDIVDEEKNHQAMRVTEYIWSADASGFQSYPTLAAVGGV